MRNRTGRVRTLDSRLEIITLALRQRGCTAIGVSQESYDEAVIAALKAGGFDVYISDTNELVLYGTTIEISSASLIGLEQAVGG
eukprot:6211202-Pleurochrysis_carterae.AAC.2